ncbi:MAG: DUF4369 domain-containing protein [Muribaculaceae bacterium]|nr:DUF4369 domain-containing protein [Muribaculaceae bacterium]
MKLRHILPALSALCLLAAGCSKPQFKITGEIKDAQGKSIVLEKSDFHGRWVAVDSTKVGADGTFLIKSDAPASPDVYRLMMDGQFVYVPVDSIESLRLKSTAAGFGHRYILEGTEQAELMTAFESELLSLQAPDSAALADFKRSVYTKYIKEAQGSILSYYVLTKFYDGKPLYDPADPQDVKYYSAVATQFDQFRPNDPHGRMVKEVSLEAMKRRNSEQGKKTLIQANEIKVIDIALQDTKGNIVRLSDKVGKGKPVVVVMSMMNEAESPAFNKELARIYNSRNGAVEIYQVSFDAGQYEWREAASNLPWINVLDPSGTSSTALRDYNVHSLPAVFLYDSNGDLVDRPASLHDLEKKI